MSIRLRLIVSFLAILLLTTANIVAYFWSSATRAEVVTRLDRARTRQVIVSTLRENIGNLHKQISLANEVKPMQETDIREFGQLLAQKLSSIRDDIDTL